MPLPIGILCCCTVPSSSSSGSSSSSFGPSEQCALCDERAPETFTIILVNNGVNDPDCCPQVTNESDRCDQLDGSFTVSRIGQDQCEWLGGPFGSSWICQITPSFLTYPPWYLRLRVQYGDCEGNNMTDIYAVVFITYPVVDPVPCAEFPLYQKLLKEDADIVNCLALVPGGIYTQCPVFPIFTSSYLCDIGLSVA